MDVESSLKACIQQHIWNSSKKILCDTSQSLDTSQSIKNKESEPIKPKKIILQYAIHFLET